MNCEEIGPDLIGLIYEEIDDAGRERVERHLAGCERCRRTRAGLERTSAGLREGLGGEVNTPPLRLSLPGHPIPRPRRLGYRAALAAAVLLAATLVGFAAANTRVTGGTSGWSVQFSLLPPRAPAGATGSEKELAAEMQAKLDHMIEERLAAEREALLTEMSRRMSDQHEATMTDLAGALARQEEILRAGIQRDKDELLKRDRLMEQFVGGEMDRTQQMLGAVLAASRPAVIEQ